MRQISTVVIILLLFACPGVSIGAEWKQLSSDMLVDTSSITRSLDKVHVNVKYIYDRDDGAKLQKTFKSKTSPQYSIQRKSFYCNERTISTSSYTYYSDEGTVLATGTIQSPPKTDVKPGSRIDEVFEFVCPQR